MQAGSDTLSDFPADSAMLAAIVDTSGSVILGLRPDHTIFAWNKAAVTLYQTARADAMGTDYVQRFIAPEHRDAVAADIRRVLTGAVTHDFEDDSLLPDGTRRTLLWNVSRVLDDEQRTIGVVATGQDITERKEAEERFRVVFEHSADGLLLSDDTGIVDCNPAALRMLGLREKHELIGRRTAEISPFTQPDGTPSDEKSRGIGAATLERGVMTFDWVHQRADGHPVPVEVSVRHAALRGRRVSVIAWRDQSHRAEIERQRMELEQQLNVTRKLEAVGQLAGGVAHDFNNLLAAIRNCIQLVMDEVPEEFAFRDDLALALTTTERAARLTGQLLSFSRRQAPLAECVDLASLVHDMQPLLRTSLPASVTVRIEAVASGARVRADRGQLEQVVLNIAQNARDAMPSGGTLTLSVGVDDDAMQSTLTISDTGMGMDDAVRQRIFEPFFTTRPLGEGTGLGLAVVYGVVTQAGGTVRAESVKGVGTSTCIVLPRSMDDVTEPPHEDAPSETVVERILLVDDDAAVRVTTRRLLERLDFAVVEAENGIGALEVFRARRADIAVVLSDIRMPGMDGFRLAREVRALDPAFPILFISGFDAQVHKDRRGLEDIAMLAKPFALDKLLQMLRAAIASRPR
ncbi:MAG: PAS domain S-box protein [Gemmatimonadaceae bacterium]|nr:PAS domain S-box protein [Gemmatimonadaceae bacterium]